MGELLVNVLSVGQGSCNLVRYVEGEKLLGLGIVDCGNTGTKDCKQGIVDCIREMMMDRAKNLEQQNQITYYLDFLIVTHQDEDHINWIADLFANVRSPNGQSGEMPGETYSEIKETVSFQDEDPICRLTEMDRHLRATYFEKLSSAKCTEVGKINISDLPSLRPGDFRFKIERELYPNSKLCVCSFSGNYVHSSSLSYDIYGNDDQITCIMSFLVCQVVYSVFLINNETRICSNWTQNENRIECFNGIGGTTIGDCLGFMDNNIQKFDTSQVDFAVKEKLQKCVTSVGHLLEKQKEHSKALNYKTAYEIENIVRCSEAKTGLIHLLAYGGSYNPEEDQHQSKTSETCYQTVSPMALLKKRPYEVSNIYCEKFCDNKFYLKLFPYNQTFSTSPNADKNTSSIISAVGLGNSAPKHAVISALFTGDATKESMFCFNNSPHFLKFSKPFLLTAPHHGSIQTAAVPIKSGWNTSLLDDFLLKTSPERIIVSHGYENQFGHPNRTAMQRYAAFLHEANHVGAAHSCYYNTTDSIPLPGKGKCRYSLTVTNLYTTIASVDDITTGQSRGKYVNYQLTVDQNNQDEFEAYDNFQKDSDPLTEAGCTLNTDLEFDPEKKYPLPAQQARTNVVKPQTFFPDFIRNA